MQFSSYITGDLNFHLVFNPENGLQTMGETPEEALYKLEQNTARLNEALETDVCPSDFNVHSYFFIWYKKNQHQFERQFFFFNDEKNRSNIIVHGLNSLIRIRLTCKLVVSLQREGFYYDQMKLFEAPNSKNYYADDMPIPANRKEFLEQEIFQPFLEWLNDLSRNAQWLNIGTDSNEISILYSEQPQILEGLDYLPIWLE